MEKFLLLCYLCIFFPVYNVCLFFVVALNKSDLSTKIQRRVCIYMFTQCIQNVTGIRPLDAILVIENCSDLGDNLHLLPEE
jgi:hypothetical protein